MGKKVEFCCSEIRRATLEAAKDDDMKATTAAGYKQAVYPRATLFQTACKAVVKGTEVIEDAREMFDPATGKKYVPFDKATKVESGEQLVYAAHLYAISMQTVRREAPKASFDFMRDAAKVSELKGYRFAQAYIDAMLRFVDEGRYDSLVSMYKAGEPTRIFIELDASGKYKAPERPPLKGVGAGDGGERRRIKSFGPVSTPLGGAGAGIIPRKCNKYHANPREPCTAGVPSNEGFEAGVCGLCAYEH